MKFVLASALLVLAACNRESFPPQPPAQSSTATTSSAPTATVPSDSTTTATVTETAPATVPETATATAPDAAAPRVAGPKLPFVDEASQDPSFVAFRDRLLAAVRAKDRDAVLSLADPKIRTSFGDAGGRADLARKLREPGMWRQLETILTLGGTFRGEGAQRSFWAPYVYSSFPDSHDAFENVAVIADGVPLREKPSADARVLATLSRDIVEANIGQRTEWIRVKTADGRSGYVESAKVRSPIDYRAGFMKSGNGWTMTALVAGD